MKLVFSVDASSAVLTRIGQTLVDVAFAKETSEEKGQYGLNDKKFYAENHV